VFIDHGGRQSDSGPEGVNSVIQQLNKELRINMMPGGTKDINAVKQTRLYSDRDFQ
jgi:lactate oxidase